MALVESRAYNHHGSVHSTHSAPWPTPNGRVSLYDACTPRPSSSTDAVDRLSANFGGIDLKELEKLGKLDENGVLRLGLRKDKSLKQSSAAAFASRVSDDLVEPPTITPSVLPNSNEKKSFHRWMRSLRRRAMHRSSAQSIASSSAAVAGPRPSLSQQDENVRTLRHRKMSSDSSLAFITAVRSASVSLASVSAVAKSKRTHRRSHGRSRTDRSSRASFAGPRISEDSVSHEPALPDIASLQRAAQRRRILEELINTEESYISDLRFLMNVRLVRSPFFS